MQDEGIYLSNVCIQSGIASNRANEPGFKHGVTGKRYVIDGSVGFDAEAESLGKA